MHTKIRVGILDFCNLADGGDAVLGLLNLVETAKLCDGLGFHRYWIGEHWSGDASTPCADMLTPIVAGVTENIRVGPAGILLNLYSPLKVASNALLASGLFPDRIDWGIARGIVSDDKRRALVSAADDITDSEVYGRKVTGFLDYLERREELGIQPANAPFPQLWILGAGAGSAPLAGQAGACFAVALFLRSNEDAREALQLYRSSFVARSEQLDEPRALIAVAGTCTENAAEALRARRAWRNRFIHPNLIETPSAFRERVTELCARHGVDEIVLLEIASDQAARLRSLRRIAEVFGLVKPAMVAVHG